jgi:hypothetical protein
MKVYFRKIGLRRRGCPTLSAQNTEWYLEGHPSLRGRILFTNAVPGEPDAAFTECNEGPADEIGRLVRQGYLVRARAHAGTNEARANDTRRRDAICDGATQAGRDSDHSRVAE